MELLKLKVKRKLTAGADRVKCVDLHPSEPWLLVALYNGNVHVWNFENQVLIKTFEICDIPVRAAKFVARKNWIVTGSDDVAVRIFNYNTLERVHSFEAHADYIRCIAVHPTQPYLLTSSDDMTIKLWNWEKAWSCQQVFEGHTHYVMQIVINPKDNNTFASASLDRNVKVWQLGSQTANFTLEGHEKGVNCVDYYHGGEKPYLISGADDHTVKIWDYQNKTCVQTLEGHTSNVSAVVYHPKLPVIITGSEDGTVRLWHANTYRLESTLNYGLERVLAIACLKGSRNVAIGYDEGSIVVKVKKKVKLADPSEIRNGQGLDSRRPKSKRRQASPSQLDSSPLNGIQTEYRALHSHSRSKSKSPRKKKRRRVLDIHYRIGDATQPIGCGHRIIAHICNNAGFWGKGFVMAVSRRWGKPEQEYRSLATPIELGSVQFVLVTPEITIANMIAQLNPNTEIPIQYEALALSLKTVSARAKRLKASVHMPRIGTGLSRGNWTIIKRIIHKELVQKKIDVYVYQI